MNTVAALLRDGAGQLQDTSTTPRLDAELLLAHVAGLNRIRFAAAPEALVEPSIEAAYRELIARRRNHEPLAYLVGTKEFYGLDFKVSPAVLVPRPDTEILVEAALKTIPAGPIRFVDLGTGSGCIAVAVAHELRKQGRGVQGLAVDVSAAALEMAAQNAARHGLSGVVTVRASNWFSEIDPSERFDLILANPPYIAPGDAAVSPELRHEPQGALFAAEEGLKDIRSILAEGPQRLAPGGAILCEFGARQRPRLEALGLGLEFFADLAGHDRVLRFRR